MKRQDTGDMLGPLKALPKIVAYTPQEAAARDMLAELKKALRYLEVRTAYEGAMTAEQVEQRIRDNRDVSHISIGANSVTTLATFSFKKTRAAIAAAEAAGIKAED
jgi:hypothetical protein